MKNLYRNPDLNRLANDNGWGTLFNEEALLDIVREFENNEGGEAGFIQFINELLITANERLDVVRWGPKRV